MTTDFSTEVLISINALWINETHIHRQGFSNNEFRVELQSLTEKKIAFQSSGRSPEVQ